MEYVTSDWHLNHTEVIEYEKRPFQTVAEMNKAILKNWRDVVSSSDTVFHLGDVFLRTPKEQAEKIVKNLPGKKVLVLGNHDRSRSLSWWRDVGFIEVYKYPIIVRGFYILSHEPAYVGPSMPYVNVHGHTHSESSDNPHKVNVSVEVTDYRPVSLDDVVSRFGIEITARKILSEFFDPKLVLSSSHRTEETE